MTKVEFEYDWNSKVQTSDGRDGIVASMCFERGEKFYQVRVLTTKRDPSGGTRGVFNWHYLPESKLSLRHGSQHIEEDGLAR